MNRNVRFLVGLSILFVVAPLVALLWPEPAPYEPAHGCMDVLGMGLGNAAPDITNLLVAGGVALVGFVVLVSCLFVCHPDDELSAR